MKIARLLLFVLCFLVPAFLLAQEVDEEQSGHEHEFHKHEIDTAMAMSPDFMPVFYGTIEPHWIKPMTMFPVDTSMAQTHQFDPMLKNQNICQNIGMYCQAHQFMNFDYERNPGFSMITLPYPLYLKTQNDVRFYDVKTSFTNLAFTYGIANMYDFSATHTQKYKGMTAAFDMQAFSNQGYFLNQETHDMSINAFVHYEIPSEIYGFTASYIFNRLKLQDNGGLSSVDLFMNNKAQELKGYPVHSAYGYSKIVTHDALFQQYVNIIDKKKRYFGTITHSFQFKHLKTDYIDHNFDSTFYQPRYYYSTDSTHDTIQYYSIINSLQWSNYKPLDTLPNKNYFFRVAGGIMHEYVNAVTPRYIGNTFTLFARMHLRLFGVMDITSRIAYSFNGYNKNDMVAAVGAKWMIQKKYNHFLGADVNFYRNSPDYIYSNYYGNHNKWSTIWPKQNTLKVGTYWSMLNYRVEFNYFMVNNFVRLDVNYMPFLTERSANVLQLHLFAPIRVKGFGFDINTYIQYSTSKALNVPLVALKASPYYIFNFLRGKLKMQIGVDLTYNTAYFADGYDPVMHQFYVQNFTKVGNYAYLDANITLRIKRITFFFRAGHFLSGIIGHNYFLTPYYPAMDRRFQIGINWKFYD